jgi:N6-L-threonylcarbamoyladenine synthase
VDDLVTRTLAAAANQNVRSIFVSGGVAANRELRAVFEARAKRDGLEVFFPSRALSTDNAAMIAAAGYPRFLEGQHEDCTLDPVANLPLA